MKAIRQLGSVRRFRPERDRQQRRRSSGAYSSQKTAVLRAIVSHASQSREVYAVGGNISMWKLDRFATQFYVAFAGLHSDALNSVWVKCA